MVHYALQGGIKEEHMSDLNWTVFKTELHFESTFWKPIMLSCLTSENNFHFLPLSCYSSVQLTKYSLRLSFIGSTSVWAMAKQPTVQGKFARNYCQLTYTSIFVDKQLIGRLQYEGKKQTLAERNRRFGKRPFLYPIHLVILFLIHLIFLRQSRNLTWMSY